MNRTVTLTLVLIVLLAGATATAAAFTDGDEVAADSAVYLERADSDNAERYVQFDENDEIYLQFERLLQNSLTRADDLFVLGFDGDEPTEIRLESTDDRVTLIRMDTGETFGNGTVELNQSESVLFGAEIETGTEGFTSRIEFEVRVPEGVDDIPEDTGGGGGSDVGTDAASADGDTSEDDDTTDTATETGLGAGIGATGIDTDTGIGLIEISALGEGISVAVMGALAAILSLSYLYRARVAAGGQTGNQE